MLDHVFALTSDGVFVACDGEVVAANPRLLALGGWDSPDEVVGRPVNDFLPSEQHEAVDARRRRTVQGTETDALMVREVLARDGSRVLVQTRTSPTNWHGRPALLGLIRPIEDAPNSETSVLRTRELAAHVFAEVSISLARATDEQLDDTIVDVLGQISQVIGADRSYVRRFSDDRSLAISTHEWRGEGIASHTEHYEVLRAGDFAWSHEIIVNGGRINVQNVAAAEQMGEFALASFGQLDVRALLVVPMATAGEVVGLVGFNAIHQTASWPEQVVEQVELIADAIAAALTRRDQTVALAKARDEAERAGALKDAFLSRISHELRTPLSAVLGFSELLLLDEDDAERQQLLEAVQSSGQALLSLIDDVLDVTKLRSDELSLELESVSLADAVAVAVERNSSAARRGHVTVIVDQVPRDLVVLADQARLEQVIEQLLENAVLYNSEGGTVTITHEVGTLPPEGRGAGISLRIIDTGRGMTADQIERAFEPFERLGTETSPIPGGGMGLSVAQLLVEAMGGEIEITSAERGGTTVSLRLQPAG